MRSRNVAIGGGRLMISHNQLMDLLLRLIEASNLPLALGVQ
jgi:hypothetical protein